MYWKEQDGGFAFEGGALSGRVVLRGAEKPGSWVELGPKWREFAPKLLEIGPISFQTVAEAVEIQPLAGAAYVQEPTLVIPLRIESPVGLAGTVRFLVGEEGLDVELRLQTVEPITDLTGIIRTYWSTTAPQLPLAGESTVELGPKRGAIALLGEAERLGIFADLRETGTAMVEESARAIDYRLFGRPLEKGVVLVGRLALRTIGKEVPVAELEKRHAEWLAGGAFL
ncbi:hypothetical protein [Planctomycetes bacterium Pan216]|uniref:hypothetical protein n=1 Tax=Kolteria novifilia TaxID=2527975 RepID=UPI0011A61E20